MISYPTLTDSARGFVMSGLAIYSAFSRFFLLYPYNEFCVFFVSLQKRFQGILVEHVNIPKRIFHTRYDRRYSIFRRLILVNFPLRYHTLFNGFKQIIQVSILQLPYKAGTEYGKFFCNTWFNSFAVHGSIRKS